MSAAATTYEGIIGEIRKRNYHPVYFLWGEEPYYIDAISDFIATNVLTPEEREFNQLVLYGNAITVQAIIGFAKEYPLMAERRVVIVKEAQNTDKIEILEQYLANPLNSTLLVICYKYSKVDQRRKFYKMVKEKGVLFESKKLYDNQIPGWIQSYMAANAYRITPKACQIMAESLGSDLARIVNESNKLFLNIPPKSQVTEEHVEHYIGISKEYNVFELQRAIGTKNIFRANQIALHFAANPKENPLVMILTILFSYFSRLLIYQELSDKSEGSVTSALGIDRFFIRDYQVAAQHYSHRKIRQIISLLREYDMRAKGIGNVSASEGELLREMVFRIMH